MRRSLVGPAIAGVVIAAVGEGYCFLIDGISYIAVIISLLAMRITVPQARRPQRAVIARVEGRLAVRRGIAADPFDPVESRAGEYVRDALYGADADLRGRGPARRPEHAGVSDVGGRRGRAGRARSRWRLRKSVLGLGRRIVIATALCGAALIAFGLSRCLWLSILILPFVGLRADAADGAQQHDSADDRGR